MRVVVSGWYVFEKDSMFQVSELMSAFDDRLTCMRPLDVGVAKIVILGKLIEAIVAIFVGKKNFISSGS